MKSTAEHGFIKVILALLIGLGVLIAVYFSTNIGTFSLSGEQIEKTIPLDRFSEINVKGAGTLVLKTGEERSLQISTDASIEEKIKVKNEEGILSIGFETIDFIRSLKLQQEEVIFTITAPDFALVTTSGSFAIRSSGEVTADSLAMHLSGTSNAEFEIYSNTLSFIIDGEGDVTVSGTVLNEVAIQTRGVTNLNFEALQQSKTSIVANGKHTIKAGSPEALELSLNGTNQVTFVETPKELATKITGQGIVQLAGLLEETEPE